MDLDLTIMPSDKMDQTDPRERSDRYRKHMTVKFYNGKQFEFTPTQFLIDDNYVGNPPKVQVSFENLNDNIDENFLRRDLEKLGRIRSLDIVRHPETRQHLGLAKVEFDDPKVALCCLETFNGKQVMGKQLSVYHDIRFTIIERRKEEKMRPQPPVINHVETPKLQVPPTPLLPTPFGQIPFPHVLAANHQLDALPRPINRQHTSLDERLAKLGLKQSGSFPSNLPPSHMTIDKASPLLPFGLQNNHTKSPQEKRVEARTPPTRAQEQEEERLWNPVKNNVPSPAPSPVEEVHLTLNQITNIVIPYLLDKFIDEIRKNVHSTLMRKLVHEGYPCIDRAQSAYEQEKAHEKSARAREENLRKQKLYEMRYFNKDKVDAKPEVETRQRVQILRQRVPTQPQVHDGRITDNDLRRVNRSAALAHELVRSRNSSEDSENQRRSRSLHRHRLNSGSRSNSPSSRGSSSSSLSGSSRDSSVSSGTSETSSSSSSSSSSSGSSSSSHGSSSSSACSESKDVIKMETLPEPKTMNLASSDDLEAKKALEAATALASLNVHPIAQNIKEEPIESISSKPIPKKRRKKENDQENRDLKRQKTQNESYEKELASPKEKTEKPLVFDRRNKELIELMNNDLYSVDEEDLKYLKEIHQDYEERHESSDQTRVPFGSEKANRAHLITFKDLKREIESKTHPRWWNGCSRTSMIEKGDKGKIDEEEMTYEDLTKAPIKSHVIQAAVSTRRDQRSDQRRIAALNPEIDPSFLKQFTANTLQMRSKNLRFSRSKIHQWGLFACEKIANGDAVIEYVGEKIRHSVADHREGIVYPKLANHDGSSYFFRVDTDVIDASFKGNKARFINHSCNPNCIAKIIKHENGTNSIVIYAKQTINEDEEITYDYKFPREVNAEDKIRCNCKAPRCHVWLN